MALTDILSGAASVARALPFSSQAVDVVAITSGGFAPAFQNARPLSATVYEDGQLMEHPLETGAVIADHLVRKPTEIDLPMICSGAAAYRSTYQLIRSSYQAGALFTVTTRTGSYPNMVILEMPHEESPDQFDAIAIRVRLREATFVTPASSDLSASSVKDPQNASSLARGSQQTTATNAANAAKASSSYGASGAGAAPQGSTLYRWAFQ